MIDRKKITARLKSRCLQCRRRFMFKPIDSVIILRPGRSWQAYFCNHVHSRQWEALSAAEMRTRFLELSQIDEADE